MKGNISPLGLSGKTKDFVTYEAIDFVTLPRHRGASLFSEKIGLSTTGLIVRTAMELQGGIWISSSPDLIHWGSHKPVITAGYRYWNQLKIGPTPLVKTAQGWREIIHGVYQTAGGTYYTIGALLLDLEEPWKVIGKTNSYLLAPDASYEQHGNCDNTVFPCGVLANFETDVLKLYYGAADNAICLATAPLSEVIQACIDGI